MTKNEAMNKLHELVSRAVANETKTSCIRWFFQGQVKTLNQALHIVKEIR